jgi:acetyl-CoA carboxylase biotin carboxylase subunit
MIRRLLIANRGEIAVRIIRASRELGIPTVAVYSTADRDSLHVQLADDAICIGDPPPLESYLNIERLIDTAKLTGANAVHPGYGFLAENPNLAKRCEEEQIIFVGPSSRTLRLVGDKIESRKTMLKAGIPVIPGMYTKARSIRQSRSEVKDLGYPVIVKASLGGGGKGMRIVEREEDLESSLESGRREAKSAFGDGSVYIEKYIESPRHIEFQILGDQQGNLVHLFERECSIQRRHQKLVEETPSVALDNQLRERVGDLAVRAAKIVGYTNAGTIEFLYDGDHFYFLEVNARIQVEHPITEWTTGVDLVKQQLLVASGESLAFSQDSISQRGHAIECRIYAEDPGNDFLPSPGRILSLHEPSGPGVRTDSGVYAGFEVTRFYDPILSKLVVWGEDRETARQRAVLSLSGYVISGIKTTIEFLRDVIAHPEFIQGRTYTDFLQKNMSDWSDSVSKEHLDLALIASAVHSYVESSGPKVDSVAEERFPGPWFTLGRWRLGEGKS